ncbi:Peptidase family C50-like protein [Elsinoe fawcettii]|nr:Peptidase family C50-like protein [Elsinoe fawcettii]
MSKVEIERLRSILASKASYDSTTVTKIDTLLSRNISEKENLSPHNVANSKRPRTAAKTTKVLKERPNPKGIQQQSPGKESSSKEQHALATDIVNKTLKILTEEAKVFLSSTENAGRKPSTTKTVGEPIQDSDPTSAKNGRIPMEAAPLDEMVLINPKEFTISTLKLCIGYQSLLLQLLEHTETPSDVDKACKALDPSLTGSPYSTICSYRSLGPTEDEMSKVFGGHIRSLRNLARSMKIRHGLEAATSLRVEMYLAWAQDKNGEAVSASHLASLVHLFVRRSDKADIDKLDVVSDLLERLFPATIGQNSELDTILASLAKGANGSHSEGSASALLGMSNNETSQSPCELPSLGYLRLESKPSEARLRKLQRDLSTPAVPMPASLAYADALLMTQKTLSATASSTKSSEKPEARRLVFQCLELCLRCWPGLLRTVPESSEILEKSLCPILESGIIAANVMISSSVESEHGTHVGTLHEATQAFHTAAKHLTSESKSKILLALSNLLWKVYQRLKKTSPMHDHNTRDALKASVISLRDPVISIEDREAGHYVIKLYTLVNHSLANAMRTEATDRTTIFTDARTAILQWIRHADKSGRLASLSTTSIVRRPDEAREEHGLVSITTAMIRFSELSKQGLLSASADLLGPGNRKVLLQHWLISSKDDGRSVFRQELRICLAKLLELENQMNPVELVDTCCQLLSLEISFPEALSTHLTESAIALATKAESMPRPKAIQQSWELIHQSWSLFKALYERCIAKNVFDRHLSALSASVKDLTAGNLQFHFQSITSALLLLYQYFALRAWRDLQCATLEIAELIVQTGLLADSSLEVHIRILQCQSKVTSSELDTASSMLKEVSKCAAKLDLPLRLRLLHALVKLEVACAVANTRQVATAVEACVSILRDCSSRRQDRLLAYQFQAEVALSLSRYMLARGDTTQGIPLLRASSRLIKSIIAANQRPRPDGQASIGDATEAMDRLTITTNDSPENSRCDSTGTQMPASAVASLGLECLLLQIEASLQIGTMYDASTHLQQAVRFSSDLGIESLKQTVSMQTLQLETISQKKFGIEDGRQGKGNHSEDAEAHVLDPLFLLAQGDWQLEFQSATAALVEYDKAQLMLGVPQTPHHSLVQRRPNETRSTTTTIKGTNKTVKSTKITKTSSNVKKASKQTTRLTKGVATQRVRKAEEQSEPASNYPQALSRLLNQVLRQKTLAYLKAHDVRSAQATLDSIVLTEGSQSDALLAIAQARLHLAHSHRTIERDVTFATLPESTLSLPACGQGPPDPSGVEGIDRDLSGMSLGDELTFDGGSPLLSSLGRIKKVMGRGGHTAIDSSSIAAATQVMQIMATSTFLLSALDPAGLGRIHPCALAWSLELPANETTRRHHAHSIGHKPMVDLNESFRNLELEKKSIVVDTSHSFQSTYIDVVPACWTIISIAMNEEADELWLSRYEANEAPLILRLPMSRKSEADLDEAESFVYQTAHMELVDIITQSDHSCHNPPDPAARGGKSQWWEDREALDQRLQELLTSMEDMWLGGFKSIFSLHDRRPDLLARFRKSFDSILDRHLPSRQGKQTKKTRPVLHSHILELFVGLDMSPEVEDKLDDDIMDLLFFVVDTLHWNGEPNAHDEVDFDAMTVELVDALHSYHDAVGSAGAAAEVEKHLILRLDKRLHLFPWESLPCLQDKSISRVASLVQLRDRILAMRRASGGKATDRHIVPHNNGTVLLNPSFDLVRTEATLTPMLSPLAEKHAWKVQTRHRPSEQEFISALEQSFTLLYFGHGSGTQYIRERSIRHLNRCADVVWLMGCSSGKVTTWGHLESESVPLSYLLAGEDVEVSDAENGTAKKDKGQDEKRRQGMCMSIVATLWDVTDRDIDNFSVSVGKKWGLFGDKKPGNLVGKGKEKVDVVPKTPAKKGRAPKTPAKTPKTPVKTGKAPRRNTKKKIVEIDEDEVEGQEKVSLATAVARSRDVCYLRYLNGAASVVYGIPTYLED